MGGNRGTSYSYSEAQFVAVASAILIALPKALNGTDPKKVIAHVGNGEEIERGLAQMFAALRDRQVPEQEPDNQPAPAEPAKPKPAHADICIERMIGGRKFRFRGFVRNDDKDGYVYGDTMLERVRATGDTPAEREDNDHLEQHRGEWVYDLKLNHYYVMTNERRPGNSRAVRFFDCAYRESHWYNLDLSFSPDDLVVCRAA